MSKINLDNCPQRIHFIGIGGISMSGLAEIMHERGHLVSGSDMKASAATNHLEAKGLNVFTNHSADHITSNLDLIVYTAAIASDNPELVKAKELGLSLVTRSEFLGYLMHTYDLPICIAGTHGKTTTTSMLSEVLIGGDLDPTITVGGILKSMGGNIRIGSPKYFLTEACEYCNSFLNFFPKVGVILNIEEDHLDYFKDMSEIHASFLKFAKLIPSDGFLAINGDTEDITPFFEETTCKVETFGMSMKYDWYASNITLNETACPSFDVYYKDTLCGRVSLGVPGMHNVYNALSICATANFLNLEFALLEQVLPHFTGADQRFEIKGNIHNVTIVDDYAHHPTEIAATLGVAKDYPKNDLYVVFQPHTYTRTRAFLDDFANVLADVPHLIVTDIYAAREKDPGDVHSMQIVDKINALGKEATYLSDFEEIADYLLANCVPGDLIITMGAGNVNQIASILLGE
ncbi:MAG: UDP-N-acetylmuramate--L-alanine ligase [Cellulosilyticaceae bacterium]